MANNCYTYDPKKIILTLVNAVAGPHTVTGYCDGEFINVERDDDMFKKKTGRDGETSRSKSNNLGGKVSVKLMQTSLSNNYLNKVATLDEAGNAGLLLLELRDALGDYVVGSAKAWVKKRPASSFDEEVKERDWVLDCADLVIHDGGSTVI